MRGPPAVDLRLEDGDLLVLFVVLQLRVLQLQQLLLALGLVQFVGGGGGGGGVGGGGVVVVVVVVLLGFHEQTEFFNYSFINLLFIVDNNF